MQFEDMSVSHHGMPRIAAALVSRHHVRLGRQKVHDLSLAFIPPLGSYYYNR